MPGSLPRSSTFARRGIDELGDTYRTREGFYDTRQGLRLVAEREARSDDAGAARALIGVLRSRIWIYERKYAGEIAAPDR